MKTENSVLILGSTGLVGQAMTHYLMGLNTFSQVFTASRHSTDSTVANHFIIDICSDNDLRLFFQQYRPKLVINASGLSGYRPCENNEELAYRANVTGVENLVRYLDYPHVKFIQYSTNAVFGCGEGDYNEKDTPEPESIYGKTKYLGEKVVLESGLDHLIIRTCDVYGFYKYVNKSPRLLHQVINKLSNGHFFNAYENVWSSPTSLLDVCEGTMYLIDNEYSGLFHLAGPESISRLEYVRVIADVFELDKSLVMPDLEDGNYCNYNTLNINRLNSAGFFPKPVKRGMEEIYRRSIQ